MFQSTNTSHKHSDLTRYVFGRPKNVICSMTTSSFLTQYKTCSRQFNDGNFQFLTSGSKAHTDQDYVHYFSMDKYLYFHSWGKDCLTNVPPASPHTAPPQQPPAGPSLTTNTLRGTQGSRVQSIGQNFQK